MDLFQGNNKYITVAAVGIALGALSYVVDLHTRFAGDDWRNPWM